MNKQDIETAKQKIFNLVKESLQQEIPTLAHVMNVKNMSETDKIFYEAYKKYGHRNQTWQDFKLMFNGNVRAMQDRVKSWKTWDEINEMFHKKSQLEMKLNQLLKKYNLKSISSSDLQNHDFKKAYPDLVKIFEDYTVLPKQRHINYTSYDPEVEKIATDFFYAVENAKKSGQYMKLKADYTHKMSSLVDLRNAEFVIGERIEIYTTILCENSELLNQFKNFNNLSIKEKTEFAKTILNISAKKYGLPPPKFEINDYSDGDINAAYSKDNDTFVLYEKKIKQIEQPYTLLRWIAHEEAHRIDYKNPNYGIVGEQIMDFVDKIILTYTETDYDIYLEAATEQSSHLMEAYIAGAVAYKISHGKN